MWPTIALTYCKIGCSGCRMPVSQLYSMLHHTPRTYISFTWIVPFSLPSWLPWRHGGSRHSTTTTTPATDAATTTTTTTTMRDHQRRGHQPGQGTLPQHGRRGHTLCPRGEPRQQGPRHQRPAADELVSSDAVASQTLSSLAITLSAFSKILSIEFPISHHNWQAMGCLLDTL